MAATSPVQRKPEWIRTRPPSGDAFLAIRGALRERNLHTVCEEARCPNLAECWGGGTATFMLLGDLCTRGCRFCSVKSGNPRGLVDREEPAKVADTIADMNLRYVVLTTVDRDDLPDFGAAHFAETVTRIRERNPGILIEVLVGDFQGNRASMTEMLASRPDVYAHNIETVERLTPQVRDRRATYRQSLEVLRVAKDIIPGIYTKSSIMLGFGETEAEVRQTLLDLRAARVDVLTFGQYLQPSSKHLPVEAFIHPDMFENYRKAALDMGFAYVASGPMVRSSYKAAEYFLASRLAERALQRAAAPGTSPLSPEN